MKKIITHLCLFKISFCYIYCNFIEFNFFYLNSIKNFPLETNILAKTPLKESTFPEYELIKNTIKQQLPRLSIQAYRLQAIDLIVYFYHKNKSNFLFETKKLIQDYALSHKMTVDDLFSQLQEPSQNQNPQIIENLILSEYKLLNNTNKKKIDPIQKKFNENIELLLNFIYSKPSKNYTSHDLTNFKKSNQANTMNHLPGLTFIEKERIKFNVIKFYSESILYCIKSTAFKIPEEKKGD